MALPSAIVKPMVAGEIRSSRSSVTMSCSTTLPGSASATSFTVHFMPPAYVTPQLCMLSRTPLTMRGVPSSLNSGRLLMLSVLESPGHFEPTEVGSGDLVEGTVAAARQIGGIGRPLRVFLGHTEQGYEQRNSQQPAALLNSSWIVNLA